MVEVEVLVYQWLIDGVQMRRRRRSRKIGTLTTMVRRWKWMILVEQSRKEPRIMALANEYESLAS